MELNLKLKNKNRKQGFTHTLKNFSVTPKRSGFTPTLSFSLFKNRTRDAKQNLVKGFTILELLVVVAIIALIAAATLALLSNARERSRDSRRLEDLRSIETSVHLYATSNDGVYPVVDPAEVINGTTDSLSQTLIDAGVMTLVPTDPLHSGGTYQYQYQSGGGTYTITFCLETDAVQGYSQGCGNTITQ